MATRFGTTPFPSAPILQACRWALLAWHVETCITWNDGRIGTFHKLMHSQLQLSYWLFRHRICIRMAATNHCCKPLRQYHTDFDSSSAWEKLILFQAGGKSASPRNFIEVLTVQILACALAEGDTSRRGYHRTSRNTSTEEHEILNINSPKN